MKKLFISVIAVCMMGLFASCTSVEGKAEDYAEDMYYAGLSLDLNRAQELEKECMEYRDGLSEEDQKKFDIAFEKATLKYAEKMAEGVNDLFNAVGKLNDMTDDLDSEDGEEEEEIDAIEEE